MKNFFTTFADLNDLKNQYRKLAFELHPDKGGSNAEFQAMQAQYEKALKNALNGKFKGDSEKVNAEIELDEVMREVLNQVINLSVMIEIVGSWIWVTGDTYSVKDQIKSAGFRFAKNKKAWYWNDGTYKKKSNKSFSLDEIKDKYGSKTIQTKTAYQIG